MSDAPRRVHAGWLYALLVAAAFAWSVRHHWFIGDDAYISFRYAANLLDGHGLVFNPGERVEGYTNFSWVLLMAAGMALGLDPEPLSLWLGTACGAGVLAVVAYWGSRHNGWASPLTWTAPLCLAVNRTFTAWCTGGLETQLFALAVVAATVAFLEEERRESPIPWRSSALFGLAVLTRPEGLLFYGIPWLALAVRVAQGRRPWRALAWYSAIFGPIAVAHEAWRIAYYGALLPNTFYAKVSGAWWSQGFDYLGFFVSEHVAIPALVLVVAGLVLAPTLEAVVSAVVLGIYVTYLAYVGGDRFEFRLLVHALPFLYVLAQHGLCALAARWQGRGAAVAIWLVGGAVVAGAFAPTLTTPTATYPKGVNSLENIHEYAERRALEGRAIGRLRERGVLDDDVVLAVTGAGAMPYFAGLPTVDLHGLNDAVIARQPVGERGEIGHEKYASLEYLEERGVVIWDVRNYAVQLHRKACPKDPNYTSGHYTGPLRCVRSGDTILVFATTLDDAEFRRRFDRFEVVY